MEFKVNSKQLERILASVFPAINPKSPMQVLENFMFEIKDGILTVFGSDLEITLKAFINVFSEENIKIVLPAKLLYETVKSLKDCEITFKVQDNNKVRLVTENGKYTLSYLDSTDFPESQDFLEDHIVEVNGLEFKKIIDQSAFAMSKEEMRLSMMGTLYEFTEDGVTFVATDGHRLVKIVKKNIVTGFTNQYIVPEKAVTTLAKILEDKTVRMFISSTHIAFKIGDLELKTRLIAQKYPDYRSVIPMENEFTIKFSNDELKSSVRRMMIYSTNTSKKIKLKVTKTEIEISAEDQDTGSEAKEVIPCEYSGTEIEMGFNSHYMFDVLSHLPSGDTIMKLSNPSKAVVLGPVEQKEEEDLLILLMPVRLVQ